MNKIVIALSLLISIGISAELDKEELLKLELDRVNAEIELTTRKKNMPEEGGDRLEKQLDSLDDMAEGLEDQLDSLEDVTEDLEDQLENELDSLEDATEDLNKEELLKLELDRVNAEIELMTRENETPEETRDRLEKKLDSLEEATDDLEDQLDNELIEQEVAIDNLNKKIDDYSGTGFGGAGGVGFWFRQIGVTPFRDAINKDLAVGGKDSPFYGLGFENEINGDYEPYFLIGGAGVGGIGNGIRLGGGGYRGSRTYKSTGDSSNFDMKMSVMYGGFIFEKAFTGKQGSLILGTLLGGGKHELLLYELSKNSSTGGFEDHDVWDDYEDADALLKGEAHFFAGDIHVSANYSFASWLHIGVEGSALILASGSGFDGRTGYTTINPGIGARVMFGNLQ